MVALNLGLKLIQAYKNSKKESFMIETNTHSSSNFEIFLRYLDNLIIWIVFLVALFYAFKCGGKFFDVIMACCCSPCYVAYRLAVPCN